MADKTQRVMWTVLPNGLTGEGRLRFSVLVGPQLTLTPAVDPAELVQFPDFLDWPAVLAQAEFELLFAGQSLRVQLVSQPDSETWRAMFPERTYVRPREFDDRRGTVILSAPLFRLHDWMEDLYAGLAFDSGDERPSVDLLSRRTRDIAREGLSPSEVLTVLRQGEDKGLRESDRGAFALHETYLRPLEREETVTYVKQGPTDPREDAEWRTARITPLPDAGDFREEIDFHRIVSSMNEHRTLQRRLGLVLDFEAENPGPPGSAENARLRVRWPASAEADTGVETLDDVRPFTRSILTDARFDPAPQNMGSLLAGPLLPLRDDRFRLIQVDLDGSAMKVRNFARSMARATRKALEADEKGEHGPARAGAPALRTGGLALVENGLGERLGQAFERAGDLNDADVNDQPIELFAEDLARGIHVDILDETTGRWQSLCRRDADYEFLNTGGNLIDEDQEGVVRIGGVTSADGENPDVMKMTEMTVSWTGWSLAAPPVGLGIDTDDQVRELEDVAPPDLPLETELSVRRGSLPSLRFGRDYRMRARIADLALNAPPPDEGNLPEQLPVHVSPRETYRRFEPLESPALALVEVNGSVEMPEAGESMGRVAIRTFNETPADNAVPSAQTARRHAMAPKVTAKLCETHGALDGADGKVDPNTFGLLSTRDGELPRLILTAPDSGTPVPDPDDPVATRSKPRYAYADEAFTLPWLPDPLTRAVLVRIRGVQLPPGQNEVVVPYYPAGDWPDAQPFQIVVVEDPAGASATFENASRRLIVSLPKAEEARVRLSHVPRKDALDLLGIWHWLTRRFGAEVGPKLESLVREGGHWMITPDREIRLYHAVQKPLVRPEFLTVTAGRDLGATRAIVSGRSPIHAKSTERLDLRGAWTEARDRPDAQNPEARPAVGDAGDQRLLRSDPSPGTFSFQFPHEFGDTRYRRVTYEMTATTRYREFMPEAIRTDPARHSVVSDPAVAWVPCTARPPAPEIVRVVPTFGWTRSVNAQGRFRSFRDGGGVRVYLRRPWMVSGAAEMLAVVLPPPNASLADIEGPLKPYVTQWGGDPVFGPARPQTPAPARAALLRSQDQGPLAPGTLDPDLLPEEENDLPPGPFRLDSLSAPGLPAGETVSVAPHAVRWDPAQRLWYCDIVVDPGSVYMPFVRMALARYQPHSREGAHLSPIAMADFVQLSPDRLATISPTGSGEYRVSVFGVGFAASGAAPGSGRGDGHEIEVKVQRAAGDAPDELGWVDVPEAPVTFQPVEFESIEDTATRSPTLFSGGRPIARALPDDGFRLGEGLRAEAERLVREREFSTLFDRDDLIGVLTPPLLWQGTVSLPPAPALSRFRLLICEYETWRVDPETPDPTPFVGDPKKRLVYAEGREITTGGTQPIGDG